jgi:signal transduction histidine kinase
MSDKKSIKQFISEVKIKDFLIVFLPLSLLIGCLLGGFFYMEVKTNREVMANREAHILNLQRESIAKDFESIVSDLMFLAAQTDPEEILDGTGPQRIKAKILLAENYLMFSKKKRLYDQIRFLNESGMEIVRINFNDGKPAIVPDDQLQDKGRRYYFKDTFMLASGEAFVSPLDLNIEHGEIEQPKKPMIRFGAPVFDRNSKKRGVVILNYFGAKLIHNYENISANYLGQCMLLNKEGYWLKGLNPEDEWGFMYKDGKGRIFGNAFPAAWQIISNEESGQFYNVKGLFTFKTIYPLFEGLKTSSGSGEAFAPSTKQLKYKDYAWKLVSYLPKNILAAESKKMLGGFLLLYAILIILLVNGSWFFAYTKSKRRLAEEVLKRISKELEQSNIKLKEIDKLKSMFIASMSHELRTPLNSIIGFTGIILQGISGEITEEQRKELTMVENSADHLLALINDVIDVSKIEAGKVELFIEEFNLADLMQGTKESFKIAVDEKNLKLSLKMPERLIIKGDETRIKQVIMNLLSNAVKFTDRGEIEIKVKKKDEEVKVSVTDTGIGIKKENMRKLFKQFSRIYIEGKPITEGTGLGLYLSKKIVDLLGGQIKAESEFGKGSMFTFTFPLEYTEVKV